jgi:hypothetical protein
MPLTPAQDFKRAFNDDAGPNTGGMGSYSPLNWLPAGFVAEVQSKVAEPTIRELARLGAQITVDGHHASIDGIAQLSGAPVEATDIRAGAGLVLAALVADGETTVDGAFHIDRGYPNFAEDLRALGANVTRE